MTTARAGEGQQKESAAQSDDAQRREMQPHGRSAMVHSIADAVVIKDEEVFFLCEQSGRVPAGGDHGLGLYYHDTRYLSGYEVSLAGRRFNSLVASSALGYKAVIELTNPELRAGDGAEIAKDTIGVKLTRLVDHEGLAISDVYAFENYGTESAELPLSFTFAADFADIFEVRSLSPQPPGTAKPATWGHDALTFAYRGKDGI
ncbi:MAG: glycogen debranching N-terminal domain-containing protein, partial [Gemmatimonadaceae bacterium]